MSEESQVDETTATEENDEVEEQAPEVEDLSVEDLKRELAKTRREAAAKRVKNKAQEAELKEFKEWQDARKSELEKAQEELATLRQAKADSDYAELQKTVAKKAKLAVEFADRVRGNSADEMLEDAKALAEALKRKGAGIINRGSSGKPVGNDAPKGNTGENWMRAALKKEHLLEKE